MTAALPELEPRDAHLFIGDDEQVYLGCAECGYGDDPPPGARPWDRAVDDLEDVLRFWVAHREQAHAPAPPG